MQRIVHATKHILKVLALVLYGATEQVDAVWCQQDKSTLQQASFSTLQLSTSSRNWHPVRM